MTKTLFIFLILLLSVLLGVYLQHDPGFVLISVNHWSLETTLWVAIPALFLLIILIHVLLLTWHKISRIPGSISHWRNNRRIKKSQKNTRKGLIEFSEGHWKAAQKNLIKALPDAETPILNYLTAARAAQEMGDSTLRDQYLREAQQSMPEATIAVELTQAQLQLANKQWEQALATLKHLQDLAPNHPYVLRLLLNLNMQINDWEQVIALLPRLKKDRILTEDEFKKTEQQSYLKMLELLIKQDEALLIQNLIDKLPKALIHDPQIMATFSQYLILNHKEKAAENILRRCLEKNPESETLIELYSQLTFSEQQLNFAESLVKKAPNSAALYLNLGKIALLNQLYGKSKSYLEESIKLKPSRAAYIELGKLFELLNDEKKALKAYREGIFLSE